MIERSTGGAVWARGNEARMRSGGQNLGEKPRGGGIKFQNCPKQYNEAEESVRRLDLVFVAFLGGTVAEPAGHGAGYWKITRTFRRIGRESTLSWGADDLSENEDGHFEILFGCH